MEPSTSNCLTWRSRSTHLAAVARGRSLVEGERMRLGRLNLALSYQVGMAALVGTMALGRPPLARGGSAPALRSSRLHPAMGLSRSQSLMTYSLASWGISD